MSNRIHGKATVARLLARQIGWRHVDLDQRIVQHTGVSIPEFFTQYGEPAFREVEREQLRRIEGESREQAAPTIVSLGGGTTAQPGAVEFLRANGARLIWLHCPIEELLSRISRMSDRPLFRDEASFRQLYDQRLPFYELSDYRVETNIEPLRVVEQILAIAIFDRVQA
jgi:shikimate kinase